MKDKITKVIAEYLSQQIRPQSTGRTEYGSYEFNSRGATSRGLLPKFCQEIAAEITGKVLAVMEDNKSKSAKCYNCKFGGNQFKIAGTTHLHCHNNEKFPVEKMEAGEISAWDTLKEWYCSCMLHQPKEQ